MFLRFRMNKLIRLLEKSDSAGFNAAISSERYMKALKALEDEGCVHVMRAFGGDIVRVWLQDHYATYQLSRHEIWINRIAGYIFGIISGVAVSVISAIVIGLLPM